VRRAAKFTRITGDLFFAAGLVAFFFYFGMKSSSGQSPIIVAIPLAHVAPYLDEHPVPFMICKQVSFRLSLK
jgi:hypothetical protein